MDWGGDFYWFSWRRRALDRQIMQITIKRRKGRSDGVIEQRERREKSFK